MSKNVAMFVDVANMYYAARGQDVDVDYVALLKHATKGRDLIRAYAYTGLDPENENQRKFIDFLGKNGYKPVVKDIRKFGDGRMKANLDIELVVDLFRLADRMDIAVIVSGDGDFAPAIKALQDKGVRCEVISFKPNTSSDLIAVADEFMDIMKVASISRKEGRVIRETGMSAPEMPAKEVTPEFGFREASPTVAAAALAALKGGGGTEAGRRARTSTTRTSTTRRPAAASAAAAPTEERAVPVAASVEGATDADPEARRRRRRRGGRGRGRTRRDDETAPAAESGAEEIGWEEFDDLSQLDGSAAEREYTFEDADAATLAELGLSAADNVGLETPVAEEGATDEAPKPARRRSTSTRSRGDAAPVAEEGATDEAPKPARRRSTSTRTRRDATPAAEEGATDEAPKPARRRSTSTRTGRDATPVAEGAATDEAPKPARRRSPRSQGEGTATADGANGAQEGDGEPQGIWGRFRTARKPRGAAD